MEKVKTKNCANWQPYFLQMDLNTICLKSSSNILLFVFIGKYFVSGLTEGAVK